MNPSAAMLVRDDLGINEKHSRVLVLGSESHGRTVSAYRWDAIPDDLNVADFDGVILDFTPFAEPGLAMRVRPSSLPPPRSFAHLLFGGGGHAIAFGDPRTVISRVTDRGSGSSQPDAPPPKTTLEVAAHASWWLPRVPEPEEPGGQGIEKIDDAWAFWFAQVERYDWHFRDSLVRGLQTPQAYFSSVVSGVQNTRSEIHALASTKFSKPVGIQMHFYALDQYGRPVAASGGAFWLPSPTAVSSHEAIEMLLRERFGIRARRTRPPWVDAFVLPDHRSARAERERREKALEVAQAEFERSVASELDASEYQGLLYETGERLEELVRAGLRDLGGAVADHKDEGRDDGRMSDPLDRAAMLEIKGVRGSIGLGHIRQLTGWMQDAQALEDWDGKGILIGNPLNQTPVDERQHPIADNALRFAEKQNVSIVTTTQLFRALMAHQENSLDVRAFWDALFEESGRCELEEL